MNTGTTYTRVYRIDGVPVAHLAADDVAGVPICVRWRERCCVAPGCCCQLGLAHDVPYDKIDPDKCRCAHARWPHEDEMLGTGSQDEIDWAAQLPLCRACERLRDKAAVTAAP